MVRKIPDFLDGDEWILEYCTEFYYDPKTEGFALAKLRKDNLNEANKIQRRLKKFFFAKAYVYRHFKKAQGGLHIRMYDRDIVVKQWGPEFNRDIWTKAVLVDGKWKIVKAGEEIQYNYNVSKKGRQTKLNSVGVWLGDLWVNEFNPS